MKNQKEKEKELISKITQLSKELNVPLIFKNPTKVPLPIKGNNPKGKEYLELIKQYNDCHQIGEKLFDTARKNVDDIDKQIKLIDKKK